MGLRVLTGYPYTGTREILQRDLDRLEEQTLASLRKIQKQRRQAHDRAVSNGSADPLRLDWRIPGEITAIAPDGDFLWLGVANFFGNYLLLMHKPTLSLVAYFRMPVRDKISAFAVSQNSLWVGTFYGDHQLFRVSKDAFRAIPQDRWTSLAVSQADRARLINGMSPRDRAMYAFYAGDDERVVALLGNIAPGKASLEEMLLLALACGPSGLNRTEEARAWAERIASRYPDSPWSKIAQESTAKSQL
jgi:hypothetical protein